MSPRDCAGLAELAQLAAQRFVRGIVLYLGEEVLPLGPGLWAVPVSTLWSE